MTTRDGTVPPQVPVVGDKHPSDDEDHRPSHDDGNRQPDDNSDHQSDDENEGNGSMRGVPTDVPVTPTVPAHAYAMLEMMLQQERDQNAYLSQLVFTLRGRCWRLARYFDVGGLTPAEGPTCLTQRDRSLIFQRYHLPLGTPPLPNGASQTFHFDRVLGSDSTNTEVYREVRPMVQTALAGRDVAVFVDGYSGTGKSSTMFKEDDSIAALAAEDIFARHRRDAERGSVCKVSCSILEVYQETVSDLLSGAPDVKIGLSAGNIIPRACFKSMDSAERLAGAFRAADAARVSAQTVNNSNSSRGHLVGIIRLPSTEAASGPTASPTLFLVDLAGAERKASVSARTADPRERPTSTTETTTINKSRSTLHRLLKKMAASEACAQEASESQVRVSHRPSPYLTF